MLITFHLYTVIMALVPRGQAPALQTLLQNVLIADRQLSILYDMLGTLIDMTDDLEDLNAAAALTHVRRTIQDLERTIVSVRIVKLHQIVIFHRSLQTTLRQWNMSPPVELDLN